jgi:small-conductance mechanosensitive channel
MIPYWAIINRIGNLMAINQSHHTLKQAGYYKSLYTLSSWLLSPVLITAIIVLFHLSYITYASLLAPYYRSYLTIAYVDIAENILFGISLGMSLFWIIRRLINEVTHFLLKSSFFIEHPTTLIVLPFCASLVKTMLVLIIFNNMIAYLGLPQAFSIVLEKISSILIIGAIAWILIKISNTAEQLLFHYYSANINGDVTARKLYTQTTILKRVLLSLILILALGTVLMLFENVRALGASVLTTAGIIGVLLTFTAQRSLASIFSGLEIALTQPIKIGDTVVVENESGVVEEINFRSVVIKLWDWRRLIIPTSQFLEKPFQNWSRESDSNLIGSVYLYLDFTASIPALREQLTQLLKNSPLWDGQVNAIDVSELQERVMQLRILSSARNPTDTWRLRCQIRETLITYITTHHPLWLPTTRNKAIHQQDI